MREKSKYLSDMFMDMIWPEYEHTLKRKKTRSNYFSAVCSLCDFAEADFTDISGEQAIAYFDSRRSGENKPAVKTMHAWLSVYRSIGRFIEDCCRGIPSLQDYHSPFESIYLADYTDDINISSLPTEKELERIFETARQQDDDQMYLILLFAAKCAMTSGEICSLTPQKIKEDAAGRGFVVFKDKQRIHDRIVKIPDCIMNYLKEHSEKYAKRESLFLNKNGKPLSERSMQGYIRQLVKDAAVARPYTIQDIRNLSIAKMLYYGANEEETAEYVGINQKWMYRYSRIIPELNHAPCDRL